MEKPGGEGTSKHQMIDCYIQTLAKVLGSEEEAKKKIYNVSCERYFGSGVRLMKRHPTSFKVFLVFFLCSLIPMLTLNTRTMEASTSRSRWLTLPARSLSSPSGTLLPNPPGQVLLLLLSAKRSYFELLGGVVNYLVWQRESESCNSDNLEGQLQFPLA
ncbi:Multiple organellar RNA editing factor 2, chloroplastic [Hordeum vulgare]|nr:Multiple organellar RNA editing factor 2, chloroplastic [Hordeum vulgare]